MRNIPLKSEIIKSFYSFRNGAVADSLRKEGSPFKRIFGLLLPQLIQIASNYSKDLDLALQLWSEEDSRESRLVAILLIPADNISKEKLMVFINDIKTIEEADILAFKVLRNISYAESLYNDLSCEKESSNNYSEYLIEMFRKNLEALKV